jgi:pimeloyl-ACP methyl ester carboxylesterase
MRMPESVPTTQNSQNTPRPIELHLSQPDIVVRGILWPSGETPVVLVHDLGEDDDLDCWADLPIVLAERGYSPVVIDLPGHGLSEGERGLESARLAVETSIGEIERKFGNSPALIVAGAASLLVPPDAGRRPAVRAAVYLTPSPGADPQSLAPKLVFAGIAERSAHEAADAFLARSRGWTVLSTFGVGEQGHALLWSQQGAKIVDQILTFLNDYRVHLPGSPWPERHVGSIHPAAESLGQDKASSK